MRGDPLDRAVAEPRRVLEAFKPYEEFHRERGRYPRMTVTRDVFRAPVEKAGVEGVA